MSAGGDGASGGTGGRPPSVRRSRRGGRLLSVAEDPPERSVPAPVGRPAEGTDGRPEADAVDRLAAELADRIGPSVHAYEVAAVLESEGLTAERIRERYGHRDLFSLAADLYRRVPRTFPEPPVPADPWKPDHLRCALRGVLFALPGLAYLLTAPLWRGDTGALPALVAAGLFSWAWGQALSHRAHLRLVTGSHEAGRTLLTGAPAGAVLASAAAVLVAGPGTAALFALGQSAYLAAAGVLLVLGRERVLLGALAPLVVGAAALPWWEPDTVGRVGVPLVSVVATAAAAGHALRATLRTPPVAGAQRPVYRGSLPYGLFGLAAGVLVLFAGQRHPLAMIALTVSMGPAEWFLYRFRGLSVAALRTSATESGFRLRAARTLAICLTGYLVPLIPAALLTGAEPSGFVALGATLWTALLLQAFGVAWAPAAVCLAAAGCVAAAAVLDAPPGHLVPLLACGGAAAVLVVLVLRLLGRPTAHA
ncbi:hypothetical protein [Streptomyces sp. SP18CS02]|uniref:hypothetical protein n=1 Tax=Streptomyces sp. SP18CS02 TaxID=3002531 RepID=UPI002E7621C8|nr:hypothetical protein [Streptomyces sp. SP18CS02]MEE1757506.1 hypothetical protein [Streptomyces sp. SP18CS02]